MERARAPFLVGVTLLLLLLLLLLLAAACGEGDSIAPPGPAASVDALINTTHSLAQEVRALATARGIVPLVRPPRVRPELVRLGRMLAFDKEMSGNRNISCMTCHQPQFATGDARRVALDETGYHTPAGSQLTAEFTGVFEFGPVSAQGMFPVQSRTEMRGMGASNELARMDDSDFQGIWRGIMERLGDIREYRDMFDDAYPGTKFKKMNFAYATNAMAGFFAQDLSFNDTPWDRFLGGDDRALSKDQLAGAKTFLTLKCSVCHNGASFSDGKFHNVALAQFGPGEGNGPGGNYDYGRMNVTGRATDRYVFRTTPLRNVELTGPYGHAGQFATLRGFIAHYTLHTAARMTRCSLTT